MEEEKLVVNTQDDAAPAIPAAPDTPAAPAAPPDVPETPPMVDKKGDDSQQEADKAAKVEVAFGKRLSVATAKVEAKYAPDVEFANVLREIYPDKTPAEIRELHASDAVKTVMASDPQLSEATAKLIVKGAQAPQAPRQEAAPDFDAIWSEQLVAAEALFGEKIDIVALAEANPEFKKAIIDDRVSITEAYTPIYRANMKAALTAEVVNDLKTKNDGIPNASKNVAGGAKIDVAAMTDEQIIAEGEQIKRSGKAKTFG